VNERSKKISKLIESSTSRASYIRASLGVNIPSQIRALRLRCNMKQADLAEAADMKQSRISAVECPGATRFNLETLIRLASVFRVGLVVRFASFSEMLEWENDFSQDEFVVTRIEDDAEFLNPVTSRQTTATVANSRYVFRGASLEMGNWLTPTTIGGLVDTSFDRETIEEPLVSYLSGGKTQTSDPQFFGEEMLLQEQKPITETLQ